METGKDVNIMQVFTRVDAANAKELEEQLVGLVNAGTNKLICDFSQNEYISSAGLRVFLLMLKAVQKNGGRMVLCQLNPFVKEVFDMAGFTQLFSIFGSQEEALKDLL